MTLQQVTYKDTEISIDFVITRLNDEEFDGYSRIVHKIVSAVTQCSLTHLQDRALRLLACAIAAAAGAVAAAAAALQVRTAVSALTVARPLALLLLLHLTIGFLLLLLLLMAAN
jgi:hypothetical protein